MIEISKYENVLVKDISSKIYAIDNTLNLEELYKTIEYIDLSIVEKIRSYLLSKYRDKISYIKDNFDILLINDFVLSSYEDIIDNYIFSIHDLVFSCYIYNKIIPYIKELENKTYIENIKPNSKTTINELYLVEKYHKRINKKTEENISKVQLKTELKKSQKDTLSKLLSRQSKNIVIANTGSGKTLLSIAYAEELYLTNKVDSIVVIVERNASIFRDELVKHLASYNKLNKYHICTYYNMHKELDKRKDYRRTLFILDEVHLLKNKSLRSSFINNLNMGSFIGLTATIVDKFSDLKNLFNCLIPEDVGLTTPEEYFNRYVLKMERKSENKTNNNDIMIEISKMSKEGVREIIKKESSKGKANPLVVIPKIFPIVAYDKMSYMMEIIESHPNDSIIIFCEYLETQRIVKSFLESVYENNDYGIINGSMNNIEKDRTISNFKSKKIRILVSSSVLNASYNLQNANIMIRLEQTYSVIKLIQSIGRIDRIGQEKELHFYNLVAKDTIEEDIFNVVSAKIKDLNDINNMAKSFSDKEILEEISKGRFIE